MSSNSTLVIPQMGGDPGVVILGRDKGRKTPGFRFRGDHRGQVYLQACSPLKRAVKVFHWL